MRIPLRGCVQQSQPQASEADAGVQTPSSQDPIQVQQNACCDRLMMSAKVQGGGGGGDTPPLQVSSMCELMTDRDELVAMKPCLQNHFPQCLAHTEV